MRIVEYGNGNENVNVYPQCRGFFANEELATIPYSIKEEKVPGRMPRTFICSAIIANSSYPSIVRSTPAATAEPITPATFGPIACMRRKLLGFSS